MIVRCSLAVAGALILTITGAGLALAGTVQPRIRALPGIEAVAPNLARTWDAAAPLRSGEHLRLQLVVTEAAAREPDRSALERALEAYGVVLEGRSRTSGARVWEILAPRSSIEEMAELAGIVHIGQRIGPWVPPAPPPGARTSTAVESEALADMNVAALHELGHRGGGIRVGIVDLGFSGFLERIGTELPSRVRYRSFTGSNSDQSHGAACAEIVADVAPEAELYLAEIGSSLELQKALDWFVREQIEVMSHSLAWFLGGGDGSGPIAEMAEDAAREGIHWVTSAGNFRRAFWRGEVTEVDEHGWVRTGTASGNSVGIESGTAAISLVLAWDRWPLSESISFQIEVYEGGILRGTSETEFGSDYPFAFRQVTIASANWTEPEFRIRADRGDPTGVRLRVFRVDNQGSLGAEDRIESGSLAVPADSPFTLAVGAYSYRATSVEPFSSYGPTGTGLSKPELIAADGVSTSLPRYSRFVGTSAACPHAAGAVALLLSAGLSGGAFDLHWNRDEIATLLSAAAAPFPEVEPAEQGWGRLRLPLEPATPGSPLTLLRAEPGRIVLHLRTDAPALAPSLHLFDVGGRELALVPPGVPARAASGNGVEYELEGHRLGLRSGRYWIRDPESGASLPVLWMR